MKKTYILTDSDKIEIVKNLPKYYDDIEGLLTANALMIGAFGVVGSLIGIVIGIFHDPLAFRAIGVGIFATVLCSCISAIACRSSFKKLVTKKISYKKFKQLERSGEIAKWQKQFENENIKSEDYLPLIKQEQPLQSNNQKSTSNLTKSKEDLQK